MVIPYFQRFRSVVPSRTYGQCQNEDKCRESRGQVALALLLRGMRLFWTLECKRGLSYILRVYLFSV